MGHPHEHGGLRRLRTVPRRQLLRSRILPGPGRGPDDHGQHQARVLRPVPGGEVQQVREEALVYHLRDVRRDVLAGVHHRGSEGCRRRGFRLLHNAPGPSLLDPGRSPGLHPRGDREIQLPRHRVRHDRPFPGHVHRALVQEEQQAPRAHRSALHPGVPHRLRRGHVRPAGDAGDHRSDIRLQDEDREAGGQDRCSMRPPR